MTIATQLVNVSKPNKIQNRLDALTVLAKRFDLSIEGLPSSQSKRLKSLRSHLISTVVVFALGPKGTNIGQAAERWAKAAGIWGKTIVTFVETPEEAVTQARDLRPTGTLTIFWTCAVYVRENRIFFQNNDTFPFFFTFEMPLDEMQLATSVDFLQRISDLDTRPLSIASHPSPLPLIEDTGSEIIPANSNAHAAEICATGAANLCITTESARGVHGLVKIISFGSPWMVFFGGITSNGADLIRAASIEEAEE